MGRIRPRSALLRRRLVGLATLTALAAAVITALPARADAQEHGYGYLWSDQIAPALNTPYVPIRSYQYNSTGAVNTVTRLGTGLYAARFPRIGPFGTLLVTAYDGAVSSVGNHCVAVSWDGVSGATAGVIDTQATVRCYTRTGASVNTRFTISYTFPGPAMTSGAYLWDDIKDKIDENNSFSIPNQQYQASSTGDLSVVSHIGTGFYDVIIPHLGRDPDTDRGVIMVTAYQSATDPATSCNAGGDTGTSGRVDFAALCYDSRHRQTNSRFAVTYVDKGSNLLFAPATGHPSASVSAICGPPELGFIGCTITRSFDTNPFMDATINVIAPGRYAVHLPVPLAGGHVQLGPTGTQIKDGQCAIAYWNDVDGVRINCIDPVAGGFHNTNFAVSFVS